MRDVVAELERWAARGDRVALATVVDVRRSAPRPPGAKMAVNEHGEIAGAVSGGCVEGAVVEIADGVIRGGSPRLEHFGIADADAWDVGLPCGGEIDVWVQFYEPGRFGEIAREGGRAAEVTVLDGSRPGAKLLVEADGAVAGSLGAPELDDEVRVERKAQPVAENRLVRGGHAGRQRHRRSRVEHLADVQLVEVWPAPQALQPRHHGPRHPGRRTEQLQGKLALRV